MKWMTIICITTTLLACTDKSAQEEAQTMAPTTGKMQIANLYQDDTAFESIKKAFEENNAGFTLDFLHQVNDVSAADEQRVAFLQAGGGTATLSTNESSKVSVGDIILLHKGTTMTLDSLVDLLVFTTIDPPSDSIPRFIRPDWDPNITDVPGGCATETGAYRRILLTWLGNVGKYLYKNLNAHRVRITNSFTHYHPPEGGFDEFYLVQMVQPGAAIITIDDYTKVVDQRHLNPDEVKGLIKKTELNVGDLIYLPRGVIHRGIGGVLAQVITVPGFIPGAEIGVDHHLKNINDKLKLASTDTLPYYPPGSEAPMIK